MTGKKIIILGAGLSGLSAAWHLQKKGIDYELFEKEPQVGGLCRSKKIGGFTFDCDGHLLHFRNRYAFELVKGLLGGNLAEHQRDSRIYTHGRYTRYPFQANLYGLPLPIIKECLLGLLKASESRGSQRKNNALFLDWIKQNFGEGIARHFMVPYNKKFWRSRLDQMTCEWLQGFIPVPSLAQIIEGTIEESRREFGYNAHFWYPKKGGISQLPEAIASEVRNIRKGVSVTGIDPLNKELKLSSKEKLPFSSLISTLPLPEMGGLIRGIPKKERACLNLLRWNSIFNLNLGLKKKTAQPMHWAYFPQKEISFFRVGLFENFSSSLAPEGRGSLYAEVSYCRHKPIDKEKINQRIKIDLKGAGILRGNDGICAEDSNDIKYGYPIYDLNYNHCRSSLTKYLSGFRIVPCGRYGSWRYFSMEDCLLDGRRAAELFY